MLNLMHVKLASDLILAVSIVYLCFRLARTRAGQFSGFETRQLENTLKNLISEAGEASKGFNDQLQRRQRDLEKLLFEAGTSDSKISRAISTAEEKRAELEQENSRLERKIQEAKNAASSLSEFKASHAAPSIPKARAKELDVSSADYRVETPQRYQEEFAQPSQQRLQIEREITAQRNSSAQRENVQLDAQGQEISRHRARFMESAAPTEQNKAPEAPRTPLYSAKAVIAASEAHAASTNTAPLAASTFSVRTETGIAPAPRLNIYGDPIEQEPKEASAGAELNYQPLANRVERVSETNPAAATNAYSKSEARAQMQKIYAAAEKLIRAGESLNTVSAKTTLPIEELEVLAQVVGREVAMREESSEVQSVDLTNMPKRHTTFEREDEDPRLGVLAGLKRQTQVL